MQTSVVGALCARCLSIERRYDVNHYIVLSCVFVFCFLFCRYRWQRRVIDRARKTNNKHTNTQNEKNKRNRRYQAAWNRWPLRQTTTESFREIKFKKIAGRYHPSWITGAAVNTSLLLFVYFFFLKKKQKQKQTNKQTSLPVQQMLHCKLTTR